MDALRRLVPVTLCAFAGLAFAYGPPALHAAFLVVFLVPARESRWPPVLAVFAFGAAALTPAAIAAYDYAGSLSVAAVAVLVPLGLNVALLGVALARRGVLAPGATIAALVVLAVPPAASMNPLAIWPLAGALFPGTGTLGLALLALLVGTLVVVRDGARRAVPATAAALVLALFAGAANAIEHAGGATGRAARVIGLDTERGQPGAIEAVLWRMAWRLEERERIERLGAATVLLPESAFGESQWIDAWLLDVPGTRVIGGARHYVAERAYVNVLLEAASGEVLYAQRAPLPAFLAPHGAHRAVAAREPAATSIDALLCVELANAWVALQTFAAARGPVLFAANLGWSRHPSLERRLRANGAHWARLFGTPLVAAVNRAAPPGVSSARGGETG